MSTHNNTLYMQALQEEATIEVSRSVRFCNQTNFVPTTDDFTPLICSSHAEINNQWKPRWTQHNTQWQQEGGRKMNRKTFNDMYAGQQSAWTFEDSLRFD